MIGYCNGEDRDVVVSVALLAGRPLGPRRTASHQSAMVDVRIGGVDRKHICTMQYMYTLMVLLFCLMHWKKDAPQLVYFASFFLASSPRHEPARCNFSSVHASRGMSPS